MKPGCVRAICLAFIVLAACRSTPKKSGAPKPDPSVATPLASASAGTPPLLPPPGSKAIAGGGHWQLLHQGQAPGPMAPQRLRADVGVWDQSGKPVFSSRQSKAGVVTN